MSNSPYVFISYAHLDSSVVIPCINAMKKFGINTWYDEGIQAGSEWPEYIAERVVECTKFVLFVSKAYLNSQNCKRELNFAISRKKDILTIYIEDVQLSPGMEMQLGTYQAIYKNRYSDDLSFYNILCTEQYFDECKTSDNSNYKSNTKTNYTDYINNQYEKSYTNSNNQQKNINQYSYSTPQSNKTKVKSRSVAALLAIFLGAFGIHKFYLKRTFIGALYLCFFWTGVTFYIGLVEGVILLLSSNSRLEKKYNCLFK